MEDLKVEERLMKLGENSQEICHLFATSIFLQCLGRSTTEDVDGQVVGPGNTQAMDFGCCSAVYCPMDTSFRTSIYKEKV